ncbi:MAG: DUF4266 domain-containing protein [Bacteroidetes bacterium]|nr:MAG: DUF4266 domain-containing protein [Bacteroidota bacterium]
MKTTKSIFPKKSSMKKCLYSVLIASCLGACTAVKPYQRQYINDSEMQMGADAGKQYTQYIHSIRQGATPAGTPKSSGGCGCN